MIFEDEFYFFLNIFFVNDSAHTRTGSVFGAKIGRSHGLGY